MKKLLLKALEWLQKLLKKKVDDDNQPDPEPQPEQPTGPAWHPPEYSNVNIINSGWPIGVVLCTPSYVSGQGTGGGSIAIGWVKFVEQNTGMVLSYHCTDARLQYHSPDGADNWFRASNGHSSNIWHEPHWYTTRSPENNPLADGTRRGAVAVPFNQPGSWVVHWYARFTPNRTTRAWLGFTVPYGEGGDTITYWWKWNQQGSQDWETAILNPNNPLVLK